MCGHHRDRERAPVARTIKADDKRASDAERDRVVDTLREHAAEGRLTVEELDERSAAALAARTRADLAGLTSDLPRARRPRAPGAAQREFRDHLRSYLAVMALLVAIWALTGMGYFWPIWPALGWGIGVFSHAGAVRSRPGRRAFG
jgi:hypothetical protein